MRVHLTCMTAATAVALVGFPAAALPRSSETKISRRQFFSNVASLCTKYAFQHLKEKLEALENIEEVMSQSYGRRNMTKPTMAQIAAISKMIEMLKDQWAMLNSTDSLRDHIAEFFKDEFFTQRSNSNSSAQGGLIPDWNQLLQIVAKYLSDHVDPCLIQESLKKAKEMMGKTD